MVAQHVSEILAGNYIGYCLGAFGSGYAISFLFTAAKKMGEKI